MIIKNISHFNNQNIDFEQRIENYLDETNRYISFGLGKIHLNFFHISNDKNIKIELLGNLLKISNEDYKKRIDMLAENFTYLNKLN